MRYRQAEKMEIIHLVEDSQLSVAQTLTELGIARSSFYDWYRRYLEDGYEGKIERYHRSLKNVVNLQHYYLPWELETEIARFVDYYNHQRYHESLNNLTPADVYRGRAEEILSERDRIRQETLQKRKEYNLKQNVKDSQIIMDSYQTVS